MTMPKRTPGPKEAQGTTLAILAYNHLRCFEYAIAAEVFALKRPGLDQWYRTSVVAVEKGALRGIAGIEINAEKSIASLDFAHTIVVPGWHDLENPAPARLIRAIQRAHARGARLLSICSGSYVLADAGLLDGKRACTHWLFTEQLRCKFPKVDFVNDVLYVDEGNIITSAGSASGIDACLHLVRRDFGAHVANTVAKRMVIAPHRDGGQAQFVDTPIRLPEQRSAHRNLNSTLDWVRGKLDQQIGVAEMAQHALMSQRTFLRRFHESLGTTPKLWLMRERIARARMMLEQTEASVADISAQCGFESMETFRVAFKRIVGVATGTYRQQFLGLN
jgi:AraC family transcriptional regulator, transcriptional activator FtrA